MPISVACNACGKRLKVPDDWVGKKAKCPGCGATFMVSATGAAAAEPSFNPPPKNKNTGPAPAFHVSAGLIVFLVIFGIIAALVAVIYFGPVKSQREWDTIQPRAEADVSDVVQRGMEAYLSEAGMDLSKAHQLPRVRQVDFLVTYIMFSVPKTVGFHGTTTQGDFKGTYDIATGEVEAECEVGGVTFEGLSSAYKHGNKTFTLTGRKKDGQITTEIDGKNAVVVSPKKDE